MKMKVRPWPIVAGAALFFAGVGIGVAGGGAKQEPVASVAAIGSAAPMTVSVSVTTTARVTTTATSTVTPRAVPTTVTATVTPAARTVTRTTVRTTTVTAAPPQTSEEEVEQTSEQTQIQGLVGDTSSVYYSNCAAAKAAGVAPLHRGDPGYRSGLDRDNDGIACE